MPIRISQAMWEGDLPRGHGKFKLGQHPGACEAPYSFHSRFGESEGTNPEELLAAAHAGCFSMALAASLSKTGHPPKRIATMAKVHLEKVGDGYRIPRIELTTDAEVPGIDEREFRQQAEAAKQSCPVSQLFRGAEIVLEARLQETVDARG